HNSRRLDCLLYARRGDTSVCRHVQPLAGARQSSRCQVLVWYLFDALFLPLARLRQTPISSQGGSRIRLCRCGVVNTGHSVSLPVAASDQRWCKAGGGGSDFFTCRGTRQQGRVILRSTFATGINLLCFAASSMLPMRS